ncbi:MAG: hypothetical protein QXX35_04770 [Desulfurococcaceae archaeon]
MVLNEIILLYIIILISYLIVVVFIRRIEETMPVYSDDYIVLSNILNRWIKYYLLIRELIKIDDRDFVKTIVWVSVLISACYIMVIYRYGL